MIITQQFNVVMTATKGPTRRRRLDALAEAPGSGARQVPNDRWPY
ncbi:MAG: hypothetical protein M0005_06015 [Actinomycetota bacterium]|nr:hypothetical protein [Actinomycetota bacterium]